MKERNFINPLCPQNQLHLSSRLLLDLRSQVSRGIIMPRREERSNKESGNQIVFESKKRQNQRREQDYENRSQMKE